MWPDLVLGLCMRNWQSTSENLAGTIVLLTSAPVLAVSDKFPNLSEQEILNSYIIKLAVP